ncbi:MAG: superoxide dismutase family protein [Candidatus Brevundimonas colombiensis]|uniref:Superoxide dismutase family protein n=1 Tax=Candidatus Brevundimonas colombiensis TaxID=3121376 RepID=A0AAJ6BLS9_9CAUL|nr:superoxide dismutase family protein [Brevundimonas sp.]WEK39891.1 MAG: superoxide dismutase family protein [Brevundimonas sp.]
MRAHTLAAALLIASPLALTTACAATGNAPTTAVERAPVGATGQAVLINASGANIGRVDLRQGPTGLLIKIEASGLTPGWHGIHIHATGECAAPFTSSGAHINHGEPKQPHGLLNPAGPDDGDLPNIYAGADGKVNAELFTTRARISSEGPGQWLWDADGSAIIIHANPDDHTTQPIGGAGDRVACAALNAS